MWASGASWHQNWLKSVWPMADRRRLLETGDYLILCMLFRKRHTSASVSDLCPENVKMIKKKFFLRCHANQHPHFHKNKQTIEFKKNLSLKASASEIMSHIKLLSMELMWNNDALENFTKMRSKQRHCSEWSWQQAILHDINK